MVFSKICACARTRTWDHGGIWFFQKFVRVPGLEPGTTEV